MASRTRGTTTALTAASPVRQAVAAFSRASACTRVAYVRARPRGRCRRGPAGGPWASGTRDGLVRGTRSDRRQSGRARSRSWSCWWWCATSPGRRVGAVGVVVGVVRSGGGGGGECVVCGASVVVAVEGPRAGQGRSGRSTESIFPFWEGAGFETLSGSHHPPPSRQQWVNERLHSARSSYTAAGSVLKSLPGASTRLSACQRPPMGTTISLAIFY
jgi:hypothetical protein